MKTRTKLFALALSTVLMSVVVSGLTVNAKKPLYCEKRLDFYPAIDDLPFTKRGWISGGIEGYYVAYTIDPPKITGEVEHYREEWKIFPNDDMLEPFMTGTNTALVNPSKGEWRAKGVVNWVDVDYDDERYANLLGSIWHSYGIFELEPEAYLVDTEFRIN